MISLCDAVKMDGLDNLLPSLMWNKATACQEQKDFKMY